MAKAIFTTSESSAYDDRIEAWYHFPKTYRQQAEAAKGDWILYYEPRRTTGPSSSTGRQAYFAIAEVVDVREDANRPDHYYAYLRNFLEFDRAVPFREGGQYYESMLRKEDGSTNKGAFGRSVRVIPDDEFDRIVRAGFAEHLVPPPQGDRVADDVPEYVPRPMVQQLVTRKFRDAAFRDHVRDAYGNTCAVTGFHFVDGKGRPEVQAAHIRSVEADGPDTVRNGIALTGTVHWLFDRGLIAFDNDYRVLHSPHGLPDDLDRLVQAGQALNLPEHPGWQPHPTYLEWHRGNRFGK